MTPFVAPVFVTMELDTRTIRFVFGSTHLAVRVTFYKSVVDLSAVDGAGSP